MCAKNATVRIRGAKGDSEHFIPLQAGFLTAQKGRQTPLYMREGLSWCVQMFFSDKRIPGMANRHQLRWHRLLHAVLGQLAAGPDLEKIVDLKWRFALKGFDTTIVSEWVYLS